MDTSLQVSNIRLIDKDSKGNAVNRVFIEVDKVINGKKVAISRSYSQFLQDMENSFLIPQGIKNIRDSRVLRAIKNIKGGTLEGNISFHKKGDKYVIEANHPALTTPSSPVYGKYKLGEEVEVENDGARVVEGFLSFEESDKGIKYNAMKDAQIEIASFGNIFAQAVTTPATDSNDESEEFSEVINESIGNEA